jgi:hypothetical protein
MLFDIRRVDDSVGGWVAPDNPSTVPVVEIIKPNGEVIELATNFPRPDVKEAGIHHSGDIGFNINARTVPGVDIENIEIRDKHTSILLYRPFRPEKHLKVRLCRFEMQAMPNAAIEALWERRFQFYYNTIERYPLDTMFGILQNPGSESIMLAGRFSLFRYEHLLRGADYKMVALLRDPIEELAERLLFVRYATSSNNYETFRHYLTGLDGLTLVARRLDLSQPETINEAFAYLPEKQRAELSNPLTRALACNINEDPASVHVEFALARLSALDLVGLRSQYDIFKQALAKLIGTDILGDRQPVNISEASRLAVQLAKSPVVQSLTALDVRLYKYVETAIKRAVEPQDSGLDAETLAEFVQTTSAPSRKQSNDGPLR